MSHQLISRSPHLQRLRNEGYNLEIKEGYLLVRDVPYVNAQREVCKGVLVMALTLVADVAGQPSDHTTHFAGDHPYDSQGRPLEQVVHSSETKQLLSDLVVNHYFSVKLRTGNYADYYQKVSIYVSKLTGKRKLSIRASRPKPSRQFGQRSVNRSSSTPIPHRLVRASQLPLRSSKD